MGETLGLHERLTKLINKSRQPHPDYWSNFDISWKEHTKSCIAIIIEHLCCKCIVQLSVVKNQSLLLHSAGPIQGFLSMFTLDGLSLWITSQLTSLVFLQMTPPAPCLAISRIRNKRRKVVKETFIRKPKKFQL